MLDRFYRVSRKCELTGIPFGFCPEKIGTGRFYNLWAPSIDRIDPTRGYTKDNVRRVAMKVNLMLGEHGDEVLYKVAVAYLKAKGWTHTPPQ